MTQQHDQFQARLNRIGQASHRRHAGTGFIVHPDGVITPLGPQSSRLRFTFPIRGLLTAAILALLVKSYLIAALGVEIYILQVQLLLSGSPFEQLAAQVLMPDDLTLWVSQGMVNFWIEVQHWLGI